jgi:hypothetical protein
MAVHPLPADVTYEELIRIRDECNRRIALVEKYPDAMIADLQSDPNLAEVAPMRIRVLLDAIEKQSPIQL